MGHLREAPRSQETGCLSKGGAFLGLPRQPKRQRSVTERSDGAPDAGWRKRQAVTSAFSKSIAKEPKNGGTG